MSTLTEIETVVDRLPLAEQEELLRHLQIAVRRRSAGTSISREESTVSSEQILAELRED